MTISDRVCESVFKIFNWYDNWRHPKRFKVGDQIRYKSIEMRTAIPAYGEMTIVKYDFYYNGWWIISDSTIDPHWKRLSFKEYELELLPPEFLQYDPKQQGDTDEDI